MTPVFPSIPDSRPGNYSPDICPEYTLAGRVRGTLRRYAIEQACNATELGLEDLGEHYFREELEEKDIEAFVQADPQAASGERLPPLEPDQVEIARIIYGCLRDAPVTALYATPAGGGFSLELVTELPHAIVHYPRWIPRPLSLFELVRLLNTARPARGDCPGLVWPVAKLLIASRGIARADLPNAICPVSIFYPGLKPLYQNSFRQAQLELP